MFGITSYLEALTLKAIEAMRQEGLIEMELPEARGFCVILGVERVKGNDNLIALGEFKVDGQDYFVCQRI